MVNAIGEGLEIIKWGRIVREDKEADFRMYKSFTYRGAEYFVYDSVFMLSKESKETDVGKILKIWEQKKVRKVKILWFFRPRDIANFLNDYRPNWRELFLASGKGKGLTNIIPLDAIIGKCNVVCTSKDPKNARPVNVAKADYLFSQVFDVGTRSLSYKLPDEIASVQVERLLISGNYGPKADAELPRVGIPESNRMFEQVAPENRPLKKVKFSEADPACNVKPKDRIVRDEKVEAVHGSFSERSKMPAGDQTWFIDPPWEEKIKVAHEGGRLVTMINLDPLYASCDVQDMISSMFELKAEAKLIPRRSFSNPYHDKGEALVVFNSKAEANFVISELQKRCLVDGDGRPVVAFKTKLIHPSMTNHFPGHISLELFEKKKRTSKPKTVSTSHCAQENTSEYQLATEWNILHHLHDLYRKALHQVQAKEMTACLKKFKNHEQQ